MTGQVPGSVRVLLNAVFDYAGLFPPAALDMNTAVNNYAAHRRSPWAWMLGKFVVPASRLDEFAKATSESWPVTVVADVAPRYRGLVVESIETKATTVEEIARADASPVTTYFEIPVTPDPRELVQALAKANARAKVRVGDRDAVATADLARFIIRCAEAGVSFKATAGLHHPLPTMRQHGFLNVLLAAPIAWAGATLDALMAVLDAEAFAFDDDGVACCGHRLSNEQLQQTRERLAISIGSCSFEEPVNELDHAIRH